MGLYRLAALFTTLTVLANADIIQFVGAPTGVNDGSYYVLPYEVTVDGTPILVVCYDIYDEAYSGDTWQAQLMDLNQAASSGFFSTTSGALADYEEVAWLDAQTYSTAAEQIGLQYAIWNVFGTYGSTPDSLEYTAAANAAEALDYAGFSFSGVRFIQQAGASAGQTGTEQTFVYWDAQFNETGSLPEPGTVLLLVLGCISLAGMASFPSASFSSKVELAPARTELSQRKRAHQKAN
ncbi:MAG TPA: hypothetical protein VK789_33315 [Bryobacteraceae bacterium]|nr:hypothetical protein [Bryobacteraceae bacterium]